MLQRLEISIFARNRFQSLSDLDKTAFCIVLYSRLNFYVLDLLLEAYMDAWSLNALRQGQQDNPNPISASSFGAKRKITQQPRYNSFAED